MPRGQASPLFSRTPLTTRRGPDLGELIVLTNISSSENHYPSENSSNSVVECLCIELDAPLKRLNPEASIVISGDDALDQKMDFYGPTKGASWKFYATGKNRGKLSSTVRVWAPDKAISKIRDKEKIFYLNNDHSWVDWNELYAYSHTVLTGIE